MEKSVELTEADRLVVQHRLRAGNTAGWRIEAWLDGSTIPAWYPVPINIRLSRTDNNHTDAPRATVIVTKYGANNNDIVTSEFRPVFEDCSQMKEHREVSFEDGVWSESKSFPPREQCWQAVIKDPFHSDRRLPGATPLEAGNFALTIRVIIDDGATLELGRMRITVEKSP